MAFTIEKILADARMLTTRLKDHDAAADSLIEQTQSLNTRVEAMHTYQEDLNELNEMARHRPRSNLIMGLVQESSQIRELQQENKELRLALDDHQSALELIMSKYREQVVKLLMVNKLDKSSNSRTGLDEDIEDKMNKICEMAAVMQRAIQLDDQGSHDNTETVSRLTEENKTLRQLLEMAYMNAPKPPTVDCQVQTEHIDSGTDEEDDEEDENNLNVLGMDDSYTSTDNSYDNPLQRSVIEVITGSMSTSGGSKSTELEQDENANSSNASSDIDTDNATTVVPAK